MKVLINRKECFLVFNKQYDFIAFYINAGMLIEMIRSIYYVIVGEYSDFLGNLGRYIWILLMIIALYIIIIRNKIMIPLVSILILWLAIFSLSILLVPELKSIAFRCAFYTLLFVIILPLLIEPIDNSEKLVHSLELYIPISCFYAFIQGMVYVKTGQYSMTYTYNVILSILVLYLKKDANKFIKYVVFLMLTGSIIAFGSRGGLFCIALAIVFEVIFFNKGNKKVILIIGGILCVLLFIQNLPIIASVLSDFFPNSRTIQYLVIGDYAHLSGRDSYYEHIINAILEDNWSFHGIYTDRIYLGHLFGITDADLLYGSYTHNIILEIMYQFGWIGILIIAAITVIIINVGKEVANSNNTYIKILFVASLAFMVGQLMFSSSYLVAQSFGIFMGVCFNILKHRRIKGKK